MKKLHRFIKFNQIAWLKSYIETDAKLRKKAKNDFEKDIFKFMNNWDFEKTMENIRKHRPIKIVTIEKKKKLLSIRNKLSKQKVFHWKFVLAIKMKKTQIFMNKPVYLGLSILELSKIVMYEFLYDYTKPKYEKN